MENIFKHDSYKSYIIANLDQDGGGTRSQLAKHLNCQPGFISQVLNGQRHFSAEHIVEVAGFYKLKEDETEFLMLLMQLEKAGTENLRTYFQSRINRFRLTRQRLPMDENKDLTEDQLAAYHSHWYYHAIHMLLGVRKSTSMEELEKFLDIPRAKIEEAIEFLKELGIIRLEKDLWQVKDINHSVGRKSIFVNLIHKNFRMEAIKSLDKRKAADSHYSRFFVVSDERASMIQEDFAEFVINMNKKIAEPDLAEEKRLYGFCLDCFKY